MQLAPGASLGHYEILAPLGAGGMGEVYRARDPRLGRDVAVKILSRHLAGDAEALARFQHEARTVAALSHPNILAIHDFALHEGMPYAVMELLEGESLRERLQRGPLPWREAAGLAVAVADGLAAAHGQGIVHRDLKPENLFLLPDGRVKILDFGLARRAVLPDSGDDPGITVAFGGPEGQVLGTIGYMSPEQARGGVLTVASDVFSLGCVLYEVVAGRRPFDHPTPAEVIAAILYEDPRPLPGSGTAVPDGLVRVIAHCLEKEAGARFASARDVALALQGVLSDSGTRTPARGGRPSRPSGKAVAVLPFAVEGGDPALDYLGDGLAEVLVNTLAGLPRLRVVPRTVVMRYKGRALDPARLGAELNATALVTGRVAAHGGQVSVQAELIDAPTNALLWGQRFVRPEADLFALQESLAAEIAAAVSAKLGTRSRSGAGKAAPATHRPSAEAYEHYLRGRHAYQQWGPRAFARAVDHYERAILADPDYAAAWAGLADALGASAYFGYVEPAPAMARGRAAAERALALDPQSAEAHQALGVTLMFAVGDLQGAGAAFARSIGFDPRLSTARVYNSLWLTVMGRHDEALAEARRAESLEPVSPLAVMSVAWALHFATRWDEGLAQIHRLLDLDPASSAAHAMLAGHAEWAHDYPRAIERFATWLRVMDAPGDAVDLLRESYERGGREGYWRARLTLAERGLGPFGAKPVATAVVHAALGEVDAALDALTAACDARLPGVVLMGADPCFTLLRGHPRFEALLARLGLPASTAVTA